VWQGVVVPRRMLGIKGGWCVEVFTGLLHNLRLFSSVGDVEALTMVQFGESGLFLKEHEKKKKKSKPTE